MASMTLEQEIKDRALTLGFDAVGITDASPIGDADVARLQTWLRAGHAGRMTYMHRNFEKRVHPAALLEGAQSVIVVALNYKPDGPPAPLQKPHRTGVVAQYAWYQDYHEFMKPLLFELADFVRARSDRRHRFKACVDSVPLAERALAVRAGLGFIGTSHMLIHPRLGPQVFLGELVTTVELEPDQTNLGACAACDRCVRACPTGALQTDGSFDAQKCISYLTIEHQGIVPPELATKIGDKVFGCDDCVLACPYQQAAPPRANRNLRVRTENTRLNLEEVLALSEESFQARFADSPIRRTGRDILQRNARICLANACGRDT
ncbi:MAG TPA: tRNA epoxyqueuosine(34) reductase QueG [Sedimentisphaerales bacterium]|nr:tRNA epoxyqueuosine(34) reductase QueG [Sedimentisphaerales bacterium]HRS09967.1 tRNA epoxyqueuosine(34) reductase QueG [Sedimentisphaerales bacterium]HRV46673.1 tRNA epoxyqueuosine(34) reductase QueG [Sedimentisphaerales bacterium]